LRRFLLCVLDVEELTRREAERARDEGARDRLDRVVVGQNRVVVDLAGDGDAVLRLGELGLQLPEVLVGLELRVGLSHGDQAAERLAQQPFGLRRLGRRLRALRSGASLRDVLERLTFVGGVALDGLDEVRDQVPPPLQLDLDLRPGVVDAVPQPDEAVVQDDQGDRDQRDQDEQQDHPDHATSSRITQIMRRLY
jgi:hypothetical protein